MLRRIIATGFTLAALIAPVGATSAMAGEYGPDEYPCTIDLSNGVVSETATVAVSVACDDDLLADFDAAGGDTMPATMADGDALTTPMVAGRITMAALTAVTGIGMAAEGEAVTLMVTDEDGDVVRSESMDPPVGETAVVQLTDLEPGDHTIRLVDEDGTDLADPATLTVVPVPAGHDGMPGDGGSLAVTGATGLPYLAAAGGLLLAGVAVLAGMRRARGKA